MRGRAGQDLKNALWDQIEHRTDAYVLLSTRGACYSPWVSEEILFAQQNTQIIPYQVKGHPMHQLLTKPFHLEFDPDNLDYQTYARDIKESITSWKNSLSQTKKTRRLNLRP